MPLEPGDQLYLTCFPYHSNILFQFILDAKQDYYIVSVLVIYKKLVADARTSSAAASTSATSASAAASTTSATEESKACVSMCHT